MTRNQTIAALKAKLEAGLTAAESLPVLSEGETYRMELSASERLVRATLRRIVDDAPLGRGFSFQIGSDRKFIYARDLRPGPAGSLIAMA